MLESGDQLVATARDPKRLDDIVKNTATDNPGGSIEPVTGGKRACFPKLGDCSAGYNPNKFLNKRAGGVLVPEGDNGHPGDTRDGDYLHA